MESNADAVGSEKSEARVSRVDLRNHEGGQAGWSPGARGEWKEVRSKEGRAEHRRGRGRSGWGALVFSRAPIPAPTFTEDPGFALLYSKLSTFLPDYALF